MVRKNNDIREHAKNNGVYLWEVADCMGIVDSALSRKLRKELSAAEKKRIFDIIDTIAENRVYVVCSSNLKM